MRISISVRRVKEQQRKEQRQSMLDIFKENKKTAWLEQSEKAEVGNEIGKVARRKVK